MQYKKTNQIKTKLKPLSDSTIICTVPAYFSFKSITVKIQGRAMGGHKLRRAAYC